MSPAMNSALVLIALGLALAAIVLATIANRRWAARPVRSAGSGRAGGAPDHTFPHAPDHDDDPHAPASDAHAPAPASHAPASDAHAPASDAPGAVGKRVDRQVLVAVLAALRDEVDGLRTHVDDLGAQSAAVESDVESLRRQVEDLTGRADDVDPTALRHVALVRYDAFADVGGRLSYSVALLDDTGSGLVLTTLAGKADVRTYVRTISAGTPDGSLTAEEQQAIDAAVGSRQ